MGNEKQNPKSEIAQCPKCLEERVFEFFRVCQQGFAVIYKCEECETQVTSHYIHNKAYQDCFTQEKTYQ